MEPQVLPDGKSILFTLNDSGELKVVIQSAGEKEPKILTPDFSASYLPTGHLVYGSENNLFAVPFDLDTRKITSGPVSMLEGILALKGPSAAIMQHAISNTGNMVYIPGSALMGGSNLEFTLVWVDRQGKEELIAANPNNYSEPKISPDGTKVAVTIGASIRYDIWIWDFARENMTRLTFNESSNHALWTPDGQRIAFVWESSEGENALCWKASDGTGEDEPLNPELNRYLWPRSWSKDGKLQLADDLTGLGVDIGCLSIEGNREWELLLHQEYNEIQPEISPDGRWMAYASNESSQFEIYVRPFPNINEGRWQISTGGGDTPLWSPDGSELFYRSGNSVMAVDVETEPTFKHEKPKSLFQGRYVRSSAANSHIWDISPDGDRFLMMKPSGITEDESTAPFPRKINIVVNWFEELKERVPTE